MNIMRRQDAFRSFKFILLICLIIVVNVNSQNSQRRNNNNGQNQYQGQYDQNPSIQSNGASNPPRRRNNNRQRQSNSRSNSQPAQYQPDAGQNAVNNYQRPDLTNNAQQVQYQNSVINNPDQSEGSTKRPKKQKKPKKNGKGNGQNQNGQNNGAEPQGPKEENGNNPPKKKGQKNKGNKEREVRKEKEGSKKGKGESARKYRRRPKDMRGRTIGARKAAFMAQLVTDDRKFICSGSIYSETHIVTAASCILNGETPLKFQRVIVNSTYVGEGDLLEIDRVYLHPLYKGSNSNKDVAVIKLKEPLIMGEGIAKKSLCKKPLEDYEFIDIYGWAVSENRKFDGHLQTIATTSLTYTTCSDKIMKPLTQNMMCAQIDDRKNIYQRYSGGAIMYKNQICGIGTRTPGIYTDASKVRGFLKKTNKDDPMLTYLV